MPFEQNIKYASKPVYRVFDINVPEPKHDVILLLHGGGWTAGNKQWGNITPYSWVSEKYNILIASMDYQLAAEGKPAFPGIIWDVKLMVMALQQYYNVNRLIIMGTSAGANIGLLAALHYLKANDPICDGFIGFYGCYDLTAETDFSAEVNRRIDLFTPDRKWASPYYKPLNGLDTFYLHGVEDTVVSPHQSAILHQETMDQGQMSGLKMIPDKNHGFNIWGTEENPAEWLPEIIEFVRG